MIKSFSELHAAASEKIRLGKTLRLGVIWPIDAKYFEAIKKATAGGFVISYLIGPESELKKSATGAGMEIRGAKFVNTRSPEESCHTAFEMAASGEVDLLLKCNIRTRDFVDMLISEKNSFLPKKAALSHIGVIQTERYHKLMFVTDGGVVPEPDASQLIQIVENTAQVCHKLGNALPKAALLAAVESISPAIPTTMLEAAIAKMSDRGQIKNVLIDGPLSFDVAISGEIARSKGITNSKVAGDADIFAMPNMETANGVYKAMAMFAKAETASIFYGAPKPIASSSVVDSRENIFNSILLASYLA
jgi:phosphate butyryltransferase